MAKHRIDTHGNDVEYENLVASYLDTLGIYHRRQVAFGSIRVDFVLVGLDLIIEIDDPNHTHWDFKAKDRLRDEYLQTLGFAVIRVTNKRLDADPDGALVEIGRIVQDRLRVYWEV
jgi:very-short-patch-repair endonuclease